MRFLDRLKGAAPAPTAERADLSFDQWAQLYSQFGGAGYGYTYTGGLTQGIQQTLSGPKTEMAPNTFAGLASHAFGANAVVFACMMVRQSVFSSIRFRWRALRDGRPSNLFGTPELRLLERPWPGGTTQDLLSSMIQRADLAGNAYVARIDGELVNMRPDWVDIAVEERYLADGRGQVGWRLAGYIYTEGGYQSGNKPVGLLPDEVAHFAPLPDPMASYRGMSWLTPVIREIQADQAMTRHQGKFFDNGATVNMVVKHPEGAKPEQVEAFAERMRVKFGGVENAYKNLHLYPGADVTVVGSNLKDIDFDNVRAGGEVRICNAANIPPIIVGVSKGLDSGTYSNYSQAKRRFADGTAHPLWQNLAGSMETIIPRPRGDDVQLWYDTTDVPFLREDEKDAAGIQQIRAATIGSLITQGFTPESAVAAVEANDFIGLLKHTGLTSVQLQKPGEAPASNSAQPQGGSQNGD